MYLCVSRVSFLLPLTAIGSLEIRLRTRGCVNLRLPITLMSLVGNSHTCYHVCGSMTNSHSQWRGVLGISQLCSCRQLHPSPTSSFIPKSLHPTSCGSLSSTREF
ncbi:hypothetical protein H4582DRAFT_1983087, partial [Lactarius indigo]